MLYGTMTYLSGEGKVLMIHKDERENDPNSGQFTIPGGKLKPWERGLAHPQGRLESAIREMGEETGLTIMDPVRRGAILFDNEGRIFSNWPNPDNYLVYIFSAHNYSGELISKCKEGKPVWVSEDEIDRLPKNVGDEKMYEWLRLRKGFFGVIKHNGRELDHNGTFVDRI